MKLKWRGGESEMGTGSNRNGAEVNRKYGDIIRGCSAGINIISLEQPLNFVEKVWGCYNPNLSISATKDFTALTELSNRAFSSLLSVSSITFSTPSDPRTAGTPT